MKPDMCKAGVYGKLSFRSVPCRKRAVRDGFCASHHPDAKNARAEQREEKMSIERAVRTRQMVVAQAKQRIVELHPEVIDVLKKFCDRDFGYMNGTVMHGQITMAEINGLRDLLRKLELARVPA